MWQSVEEGRYNMRGSSRGRRGTLQNKQMKSDRRRVAHGMQYRKSLRTFLQRLSMPKLVAQCPSVS